LQYIEQIMNHETYIFTSPTRYLCSSLLFFERVIEIIVLRSLKIKK